jgi:hypothetical protein
VQDGHKQVADDDVIVGEEYDREALGGGPFKQLLVLGIHAPKKILTKLALR